MSARSVKRIQIMADIVATMNVDPAPTQTELVTKMGTLTNCLEVSLWRDAMGCDDEPGSEEPPSAACVALTAKANELLC